LVVGAGVAGLEAARTALELGARVTLTDSAISLGGSVLQWSELELKRNFTQVVSYLISEITFLEEARLARELGATVDESVVLGLQPDFVLDATGARPPDKSPSYNDVHISEIVKFEELLRFHHVTVQADSPLCGGLHLAKWLAERGCEVRVISSQEIGSGLDFATFTSVLRDLRGHSNVTLTNYSSPLKIEVGQLHMRDLLTGATSIVGCEMLVRCNGLVPNLDFASSMAKIGWPTYQIGDSAGFRGIEFAIRDARVKVLKLNAEWKKLAGEKS